MRSVLRVLLSCVLAVAGVTTAPAQELTKDQFLAEFSKGVELADDKIVDKALKRGAYHALNHYEALYYEKELGKESAVQRCNLLLTAWKRVHPEHDTLDQLDRWLSGSGGAVREQLQKGRTQSYKLWTHYTDEVLKSTVKADYERVAQQFQELARAAESIGHAMEVAELWNFVSVVTSKMPEASVQNRKDAVFATEQFLEARKRWNFTFDTHYIRGTEFVKGEKAAIEQAEKAGDKRKAEGYAGDAKGVDALVMPNVPEAKHALKFEALANWEELDYGAKTSPVPAFWWMASMGKVGTSANIDWFRKRKLVMHRLAPAKAALGFDGGDGKFQMPIDISSKGKVSSFWLDPDKKQPYAMVFWTGSDREMVNEAECNLAPNDTVCNVYYRSAASWKTTIGTDQLTFYDDSADGEPGNGKPFEHDLRVHTLGAHDTEGTQVPQLDSMRVGKGPRVPFSEFVKLSTGWVHLTKKNTDEVGIRPLNPEYMKTGKLKLVWNGPKPTQPVQLVVKGRGEFYGAMFDVASGKEVEVPAAEYDVIWGRVAIGKGPRVQTATLYQGSSKSFKVEPGATFELKMGGPFVLSFNRRGDESASIDALKIQVAEASGCVFGELHGIGLPCEVLASKEADGKGAAVVGKFVRFTDPELVNKAATQYNRIGLLTACFPMPDGYKSGEMVLSVKLPSPGMKLAVQLKKHPLFGDVKSAWQ